MPKTVWCGGFATGCYGWVLEWNTGTRTTNKIIHLLIFVPGKCRLATAAADGFALDPGMLTGPVGAGTEGWAVDHFSILLWWSIRRWSWATSRRCRRSSGMRNGLSGGDSSGGGWAHLRINRNPFHLFLLSQSSFFCGVKPLNIGRAETSGFAAWADGLFEAGLWYLWSITWATFVAGEEHAEE